MLSQGQNSILVLSTRTWLCYSIKNRFHMTPVGQDSFEHASNFASEPCPEGLVTIQVLLCIRDVQLFFVQDTSQKNVLRYNNDKAMPHNL